MNTNPEITSSLNKAPVFDNIKNPLWITVSEAAKITGVQSKTIRRAIKLKLVNFKIVNDRYLINLESLIIYFYTKTKLRNKLIYKGIGQYISKWRG